MTRSGLVLELHWGVPLGNGNREVPVSIRNGDVPGYSMANKSLLSGLTGGICQGSLGCI